MLVVVVTVLAKLYDVECPSVRIVGPPRRALVKVAAREERVEVGRVSSDDEWEELGEVLSQGGVVKGRERWGGASSAVLERRG